MTSPANSATRFTAAAIGIYGGLLGMMHGYFVMMQGAVVPAGVFIQAMGDPCQPEAVAHACLPALTLIPHFLISGSLALIVSGEVLIWSLLRLRRNVPVLPVVVAALLMLVTGAGFFPVFYALIAAATATQIQREQPGWSGGGRLAVLYPGLLIAYFGWMVLQVVFSQALNPLLLSIGGVLIPLEWVVLVLAVSSAFARDRQHYLSAIAHASPAGVQHHV